MQEPPRQNRRGHKHQPKDLIAPESSPLLFPLRLFGHLLEVGFDSSLHHGWALLLNGVPIAGRHASV